MIHLTDDALGFTLPSVMQCRLIDLLPNSDGHRGIISRARLAVHLPLLLLEMVLHGVHASTGARPPCLVCYFFVCISLGFLLRSPPHIAFQRCGRRKEGGKAAFDRSLQSSQREGARCLSPG